MKKKLLSWLFASALILSSGQMAFADELSDGTTAEAMSEAIDTVSETELLLPESTTETIEVNSEFSLPETTEDLFPSEINNSELLEEMEEDSPLLLPDNNEDLPSAEVTILENTSDALETDQLTSEEASETTMELIDEESIPVVTASINSSIQGNSDGSSIRESNFTEAEEGNVLIGITGEFVRDAATIQDAIDLINSYRLQACKNGEPDPRNSSRNLTEADYVPITWSAALEWIAQTRAAEASYTHAHSRVGGGTIWLSHNGVRSCAEVLAWNASSTPMLTGITQWYGERNDWINKNNAAETGHYTSMINPSIVAVGLGCFRHGSSTVCGQFYTTVDSDTTPAASGYYTQIVQYAEDSLELSIGNLPDLFEVGTTSTDPIVQITSAARPSYLFTPLENATWSTANSNVASVNSSGAVTAHSEGSTTITLSWRGKITSGTLYTVKRPSLSSAKNVENGVQLNFSKSQNIDGYNIYRKESSSWAKIAAVPVDSDQLTASGNTITYVDTTAKSGVIYSYSVSAYRGKTETSYDTTGLSGSHIDNTSITVQNADNGVQMNWTANSLLQGYRIYRKTSGSSYQRIATVGAVNTYTDQSASDAVAYTYKVQGYNTVSESGSNEVEITRLKSQNVNTINTKSGIRLTWDTKSYASNYRIYRSLGTYKWEYVQISSNTYQSVRKLVYENYELLTTTGQQNTYVDTDVETGSYYSYRVQTYYKGSESSSNESSLRRFAFLGFSAENTTEGVDLSWTDMTGYTNKLELYRKTANTSYQLLTTLAIGTTKYTDTTATEGTSYTYKIVGCQDSSDLVEEETSIVRLKPPVISSAVNTQNGIRIAWNKQNYAEEYRIYRATGELGWVPAPDGGSYYVRGYVYSNYELLSTVKSQYTYTDSAVTIGDHYSYRVEVSYKGGTASTDTATIRFAFSTFQAQNQTEGIQLNWDIDSFSPDSYTIYRKSSDTDYQKLTTVQNYWYKEYMDMTAQDGITYTYKIVGTLDGGETTEREVSLLRLKNPVFKVASNTMDGIKISWEPVANCNGYNIYRVNSNGSLKRLGNVKSDTTTYIDTNVVSGTAYTYAVKAYKGNASSSYNTLRKCFLAGVTAKAENDLTGIKITWNRVSAASGYRVYRKPASSTENFTLLATINSNSTTSYIDTEKHVGGRAFVYYVRAFRGGVLSTGKTSTMRSLVVPHLTLTTTTGKVQLKWTKSSGAKEYFIYRKSGNGSYQKIATVTGVGTVRYTDSTTVKGTKYTYAVRANNGGKLSAFIGKTITAK